MQTTLIYDHYYKYDELTTAIHTLANNHKDYVEIISLNKTPEGRDIWCMIVTNRLTGDPLHKPAYYVDGNQHAGEVISSMAVLYLYDYLLSNLGTREIDYLLDNYTFYLIPRVTPDGAEHYLSSPDTLRSINRMYPYSDLMPGLQRKDMDGDGSIRSMRIKSPFGAWKVSDNDKRIMIKRRPDDIEGDFYNIYDEGYIEQYDGLNIQQAPLKYSQDINRNYPIHWRRGTFPSSSGEYPLCNIESRSVVDFILSHQNICFAISFHSYGGYYLYPPTSQSSKTVSNDDMTLYKVLGKIATQETGYPVLNIADDYLPQESGMNGDFAAWCHFDQGIPSYSIECWDIKARAGIQGAYPRTQTTIEEDELNYVKLMKWNDENLNGKGFLEWTLFEHPQLGEVEIGGFDYKYMIQNCPIPFLVQELDKHTRFIIRNVKALPKIVIHNIEANLIDNNIYEINAYIGNKGYISTYLTKEAKKLKIDKELEISCSGDNLTFLSGKSTHTIGHLEGFSGIKTGYGSECISTYNHEPFIKKVTWLFNGKEGQEITIICSSQKGGTVSKTIIL